MTENRENGQPDNGRAAEDAGRARTGGAAAGERPPETGAGPGGPGGPPPRDPIGSVAEEALKLFDTLQERVVRELVKGGARAGMSGLGQAIGGRSAPRDVWGEAVADAHHEDQEYICRACPICRVKAASRDSGGEIADHLVAAGGELFAALRQAVEALQRPATGGRPREREREPRPSRAEHVDLG